MDKFKLAVAWGVVILASPFILLGIACIAAYEVNDD